MEDTTQEVEILEDDTDLGTETYTKDEVEKLVQKRVSKLKSELKSKDDEIAEKVTQALDAYKLEQNMTAEELAHKKFEEEKQALELKLQEYEAKEAAREVQDYALDQLKAAGLKGDAVEMLVKKSSTKEEVDLNIKIAKKIVQQTIIDTSGSEAPRASSGSNGKTSIKKNNFSSGRII